MTSIIFDSKIIEHCNLSLNVKTKIWKVFKTTHGENKNKII